MAPSNVDAETASWTDLKDLAPGAIATLITVATNPVEWFRGHFLGLVVEYVIFRPLAWGLAHVVAGFERVAGILAGGGPILASPFVLLGDKIVGAVNTLYRGLYGLLEPAPFTAPIATVATVVIVLTIVVAVAVALASVLPTSSLVMKAGSLATKLKTANEVRKWR